MTPVLVDTSVWIDHFRRRNNSLVDLLSQDRVLMHPMVLLEIACGTPPAPRHHTLRDLGLLRSAMTVPPQEVMDFIERAQLHGLGCGLVDLSLLAATLVNPGASMWTLDKRLAALAARLGVAHGVSPAA